MFETLTFITSKTFLRIKLLRYTIFDIFDMLTEEQIYSVLHSLG